MKRKIDKTVFFYDSSDTPIKVYDSSYKEPERGKWNTAYDWFSSITVSFVIIFILFSFVFRAVAVSGSSMESTLSDKDWLLVNHTEYVPQYGDIVVITQPNVLDEPIIKRVIAVGGDTVDIDFGKGVVSVNGKELDEPYTNTPTNRSFDIEFPKTVPEGFVFVMGDNRNNSLDSRSSMIGFIDERYILGKVITRVFPFQKIDSKINF